MFRAALLLVLASLLSGCAMSEEDKAFYYRGWLNPKSLDNDTPPPSRYGGPPVPPGFKRDPLVD